MKKKIVLIVSSIVIAAGAISTGVGFTLAKYLQKKEITQQTAYEGSITEYSIFLDVIHTWGDQNQYGWATNNAVFYMYCFDSTDPSKNTWVASCAHMSPTIGGNATNLYAFRFDSTKYTHYNLVRFNPNGSTVPGWGWDNGSTWNATAALAFNSYTYNYYKINGGETANGDGYGHTTSNVTSRKINYNYSTSTWSFS